MSIRSNHLQKRLRYYLGIAGWLVVLAAMLFAVHFFTDNKLEGRMSKHVSYVAKQQTDQVRRLLAPVGISLGETQATICGIGDPAIGNYDCTAYTGATFTPVFTSMNGATIARRLDELDGKMKKAGWLLDANDFRTRSPNSRPYWESWFDTSIQDIAYIFHDDTVGCSISFTLGFHNRPPQSPDQANILSCSESKP